MALFLCSNGSSGGGVKVVTENFTTSSYGYVTFPNGRQVINAKIGDISLFIRVYNNYCTARYGNNSANGNNERLDENTAYSITYSYIELTN